MRFAIVINLDYDSNPEDVCRHLWRRIRDEMLEEGFRLEGRLFTMEMKNEHACDRARVVIDRLNEDSSLVENDIYNYLKEFYGYNHTHTVNLLLPPTTEIRLDDSMG